MEVFVRLSIQKYFKSKTVTSILDAIKLMFEQSVLPVISKFDCHDWRKKRLWNEECDNVIKFYLPLLKVVYEKYYGKYSKPGMPKYLIDT
jgi:hypothetical protein